MQELNTVTKRLIEDLPDQGLERVIAFPNERFDWHGNLCVMEVVLGYRKRGRREGDGFWLEARKILGVETACDRIVDGWDHPLQDAEEEGERDLWLNEFKAYCAEVLAARRVAVPEEAARTP